MSNIETASNFLDTLNKVHSSVELHTSIQPVFVSRKIEQELNVEEPKPPIVNRQYFVDSFQCDLCDAGYVGYTRGHLHNRVK